MSQRKIIKLTFPFKLISKDNEKFFNRHTHRPFTSQRFKAFATMVAYETGKQYKGPVLLGTLLFKLTMICVDKRHVDLLNAPKSVADALQGVVFKNDKQIVHAELLLVYGEKEGFVVEIEEIELTYQP
jgi:Holliday junction resolvase RusA-like endonuclease